MEDVDSLLSDLEMTMRKNQLLKEGTPDFKSNLKKNSIAEYESLEGDYESLDNFSTPSLSAKASGESEQENAYAMASGPNASLQSNLYDLEAMLNDLDSPEVRVESESQRQKLAQSSYGPSRANVTAGPLSSLNKKSPSFSNNIGSDYATIDESRWSSHQNQPNVARVRLSSAKPTSAVDEIDALMSSLNHMQVEVDNDDPVYATVRSSAALSPQVKMATSAEILPTMSYPPPNSRPDLDSLVNCLGSELNRQGAPILEKGNCAACGKPVVGQVFSALEKLWHLEHFTCAECGRELRNEIYCEHEGQPYCEADYQSLFAPSCAACGKSIVHKCLRALNNTWHPECFVCIVCGKPFDEDGFHEKDGKPYCRLDYCAHFAPRCDACERPITDNYIVVLDKHFHPHCFACKVCGSPLSGNNFYELSGETLCQKHYHTKRGSLCYQCQKPITGQCVTALYRKYHPDHFVCTWCKRQLNTGVFKERDQSPYCQTCYTRLFS